MASTYDRIETENSLLDEIIYNSKLIIQSIIIKDEAKALSYETKEMITNFDIYRAIKEGRISLYYFEDIEAEDIKSALPNLSTMQVREYFNNVYAMPKEYQSILLTYLSNKFIEEYDEPNDYYRLVSGKPPSDQPEIYLTRKDIIDISSDIDITKPIHKFSDNDISIIKTAGVLDKLKERYPEATYLNYIDKGISFYSARIASKYDILYISADIQDEIMAKFKELYVLNTNIVISTIDDVALKYYHELYNRFLMMTILVNTIADLISEFSDFFINREVFDIRTAEYFFNAFGVDFYRDIPMKYQKRLIRNLNKLIKYKGTSKNMINITQIFGFENIDIYKYYLNKYHIQRSNDNDIQIINKDGTMYNFPGYIDNSYTLVYDKDITDANGNIIHHEGDIQYDEDGNPIKINEDKNYEMRFIKVPIREMVNSYLKDDESIFSYDDFIKTYGDSAKWNGDKELVQVKKEIMEMDFNTLITQFMSVSTSNSMTDINMQITYFINMLMYYGIDPKNMTYSVHGIDNKDSEFNIFDTLVFIYALMYMYVGYTYDKDYNPKTEETIVTDPLKLANIHGFDLYANLDEMLSEIESVLAPLLLAEQEAAIRESDTYVPYTIDSLKMQLNAPGRSSELGPYANMYLDIAENIFTGTNKFVTFGRNTAPTIQQMVTAYTTNKGIHDYIEARMIDAQDINEYKMYRDLYDALMVVTLNNDLFQIVEKGKKRTAKSYIEYLQFNCPRYYAVIKKIMDLAGTEECKTLIYDQINNACDCTISYINSNDLMEIFSDLPIDTVDYIKMYMIKIIEFFMSFKVTIIDSRSMNRLDPEKNRFVDHSFIHAHYYMKEENRFKDSLALIGSFGFVDIMRPKDTVIVKRTFEHKEETNV